MKAESEVNGGEHPFEDAIAVWHMSDLSDSAGDNSALTVVGDVRMGVELTGKDREASLRRGGDGRAAVFNGGYLSAGQGADGELNLTGQEMTMCIRLCDPSGAWDAPLFGKYGGDDRASYHLYCIDGGSKPFHGVVFQGRKAHTPYYDLFGDEGGPKAIQGTTAMVEFVWGTTPRQDIIDGLVRQGCGDPLLEEARKGVMKVNFPVALIGPEDWHDVIVRFTGPKLDLFIDGVLADEEFPIGSLRQTAAPCLIGAAFQGGEVIAGFRGLVDHAALWSRALSDDEIVALSGGADEVARRDQAILGEQSDRMQYWSPRGHNARAGDCMPFFHDGVFHLYYLIVRRNHHSKWQSMHGGLQIGHASTTDLIHWTHHPLAIPVTEQWQSWWGTGGFVYHNGMYHTFQKVPRMLKECDYGGIQMATSRDAVHFDVQEPHPFLPGTDCEIFEDEESGLFHLITLGERRDDGHTSLKRYYSSDLLDWQEAEQALLVTDSRFNPDICPHLFEWNGWYYLMAGGPVPLSGIWMSRHPFGPWTLQRPVRLDLLAVPKTAEFTGGRRIMAGFLEDRGWGGNLVFRELVQHADGSLGTKFPPEMIPSSGEPLELGFESKSSGATRDGQAVQISAPNGCAAGVLTGVPNDARITLDVLPKAGSGGFGLRLRSSSGNEQGCELRFEPAEQRVAFSVPHRDHGQLEFNTSDAAIGDVQGLDRRFTLDIVLRKDIVDACIDDRRTIVARDWDPRGHRLVLYARDADVIFKSIVICPLLE